MTYSQHCFETLQQNAGVEYDHFVVDQASADGTEDWLDQEYSAGRITAYSVLTENVGICKALNMMLDEEFNPADYDVVVRFDNDCEVTQPDTLRVVCEVAAQHEMIVAPRVLGLRNPPPTLGPIRFPDDRVLDETAILGGIFMAIPAKLFSRDGFRFDESMPLWTGDEAICAWHRGRGGHCGYLDGYSVNHYLTTDGQAADLDWYFNRRVLEGGPAR